MGTFHGTIGSPELVGQPTAGFKFTYRQIRIDDQSGFRSLDLGQLEGTVLALDWVAGDTHHIWGSAIMVAPGVALTARHVVDDMRDKGFLGPVSGYLLALGFHNGVVVVWNVDSFTSIADGDLSILTLVRTTVGSVPASEEVVSINFAVLAARQPSLGEHVSLIGFAASEAKFEDLRSGRSAGIDLLGSVGPVTDIYADGRDQSLLNPSAGVSAKTIGGMSGGAAFDARGRLIGIITSGVDEESSFISLAWPCVFTPLEIHWPPGLFDEPTTLHAMAQGSLCRIENVEALILGVSDDGEPMVGLSSDA
jgi:Trypsin-like peptidase domain